MWSTAELDRLRRRSDPAAAEVVTAFVRTHRSTTQPADQRSELRPLIQSFFGDLRRRATTDTLPDLVDPPPLPPAWADPAQIEIGQRFFRDHGLEMSAALFLASLPVSYAVGDSAVVLARFSDLAGRHLGRRIGETGQMLIDVMGLRGDGSFQPGGRAYTTATNLRLLHALVREVVTCEGWGDVDRGVPANQELMLGTIVDFTAVSWAALERMGVDVPEEVKAAHLHVWSVTAWLMGVAPEVLPLRLDDVPALTEQLWRRNLEQTDEGRQLMGGLLELIEYAMPLGWRRVPPSLIRWLFASAPGRVPEVPDLLGVPTAAWWSGPVFSVLRRARRLSGPLTRLLFRRLGRLVIVTFADRAAPGEPPFRVPEELARVWRVKLTGRRAGVRRLRRRARVAVRRTGPPGTAGPRR